MIKIVFILILILFFSLTIIDTLQNDITFIDHKIEEIEIIQDKDYFYIIENEYFRKKTKIIKIIETNYYYHDYKLTTIKKINYGIKVDGNYYVIDDYFLFNLIFFSSESIENIKINLFHNNSNISYYEICKINYSHFPIKLNKIYFDNKNRIEFYHKNKLLFALEDYH